jgi:AraC-like DNA-binding protein
MATRGVQPASSSLAKGSRGRATAAGLGTPRRGLEGEEPFQDASGGRGYGAEFVLTSGSLTGHLAAETARISTSFTLSDLASAVGISTYHLARTFKAETGLAPHAYQIQMRVLQAKRLLAERRSIAASAAEGGFCDQAHLTHLFKRRHGRTAPGLPGCDGICADQLTGATTRETQAEPGGLGVGAFRRGVGICGAAGRTAGFAV